MAGGGASVTFFIAPYISWSPARSLCYWMVYPIFFLCSLLCILLSVSSLIPEVQWYDPCGIFWTLQMLLLFLLFFSVVCLITMFAYFKSWEIITVATCGFPTVISGMMVGLLTYNYFIYLLWLAVGVLYCFTLLLVTKSNLLVYCFFFLSFVCINLKPGGRSTLVQC